MPSQSPAPSAQSQTPPQAAGGACPSPAASPPFSAPASQGWSRWWRQLRGKSPFAGTIQPRRVPLLAPFSGRPTLPFPHPGNYQFPLQILESFFWGADQEPSASRHHAYLEVPGFAPVLVTRDPKVIRAITTETGDLPGQFERDTLPSSGIARATGEATLLYANGPVWRRQKRLAAAPFGKTALFQPEQFASFANTFRHTVRKRLNALQARLSAEVPTLQLALEPEIKTVMLELLTNSFFGTELTYQELREVYVPAMERVIEFIVRDTVINRLGLPLQKLPSFLGGTPQARADMAQFDKLTDLVLAARPAGKGLWKQFRSDAPDAALRANLKVFLAGALEATTSFASWAIAHLSRHPADQARVYAEVQALEEYLPEHLGPETYLGRVLEETLRLTPALYFFPRRPSVDTWVETSTGETLWIPRGTHLLLDVWHANRHEDHWGVQATGYPAEAFVPDRWTQLQHAGKYSKENLHFGFGHGPRVCPGKHLGQLEVALVVGAFVKLFEFQAVHPQCTAKVGVSTKPADGVLLQLKLRHPRSARG